MKTSIHARREETPNDLKLSDSGVRRGTCMVGGKAAAGSSGRDSRAGSLQAPG